MSVLAKVVERVLGRPLMNYLPHAAFGLNQWAYRKRHSARDLATLCTCRWILSICSGQKVGIYLSDISGAFDRVFKQFLIAKLITTGILDLYVNFLSSYLEPRVGKVTVEGALSSAFELADTVFQGTVLGPTLWNTFFGDVAATVTSSGGEETIFADDLNVHHFVPRETSTASLMHMLRDSQQEIHAWGRRNRVLFDPSKEHFCVIHSSDGEGEPFKLLGCLFDPCLNMHAQIDQVLNRVRPRVVSLLRTRNKYSVESMMHQYKSHIWSVMEYSNGCIAHATGNQLERSILCRGDSSMVYR